VLVRCDADEGEGVGLALYKAMKTADNIMGEDWGILVWLRLRRSPQSRTTEGKAFMQDRYWRAGLGPPCTTPPTGDP
jgi:hypothetical protein